MSRPTRNADANAILSGARTFFVTTNAAAGKHLLQSERNAELFIEVLRHYVRERKFVVHDFVVMPNHVHILLTVGSEMSVEKAVQFVKGGFSYRLKKEYGYPGEVWQKGFSEVRVEDRESYLKHREYIAKNPVRDGLVREGEEFPHCFASLKKRKLAGAKARDAKGRPDRQR